MSTPLESLKAALAAMETASADWTNSIAAVKGVIKELEAVPPPPVEEPPKEEPKPPPVEEPKVEFLKGLVSGYWGSAELADLKAAKMPVVRLDQPESIKPWTDNGQQVIYLQHGDVGGYNKGGVRAVNIPTFVAHAEATIKANPGMLGYECFNEPGQKVFWGLDWTEADVKKYCEILRALAPKRQGKPILASFDGGQAGSIRWGETMLKVDPTIFQVEGIEPTMHPYDGSTATTFLAHWANVERCFALTKKLIWFTEYGRPTNEGTGDSPKTSESAQAEAVTFYIHKSRESKMVQVACWYGYREGKTSAGYALVRLDDTKKKGWEALINA